MKVILKIDYAYPRIKAQSSLPTYFFHFPYIALQQKLALNTKLKPYSSTVESGYVRLELSQRISSFYYTAALLRCGLFPRKSWENPVTVFGHLAIYIPSFLQAAVIEGAYCGEGQEVNVKDKLLFSHLRSTSLFSVLDSSFLQFVVDNCCCATSTMFALVPINRHFFRKHIERNLLLMIALCTTLGFWVCILRFLESTRFEAPPFAECEWQSAIDSGQGELHELEGRGGGGGAGLHWLLIIQVIYAA